MQEVRVLTNSLAFPNMFDTARNRVGVLSDNESIVNRSRLLILTSPTELYNEPEFGVGLKEHLFQYNTENQKSIIRDKITDQLRMYEPACEPDKTQFADGLLFTGDSSISSQDYNKLKMTVSIQTKLGDTTNVDLSDLQSRIDYYDSVYSTGG